MTLTLILIGGSTLFLAVVIRAVTSTHTDGSLFTGEMTSTEFADPAAETLCGSTVTPPPAKHRDWQLQGLSSLRDAEDLLDSLEARGYTERELLMLGNAAFAVRWR
jgi:hypothetical protein